MGDRASVLWGVSVCVCVCVCVCMYKLTEISASRSQGRNPALILANYMKDLIIVLR